MPLASLALLLLPLLQCLHFPVSGPCPQSPFSLLTPLPSLFPISLLTSLPSLLPHPVTPPSPAWNPTPSPTALTTRASSRPRPGPSRDPTLSPRRACPELAEGRGPSGIQPPGRFQLPRPPLHTERTALFLPYPRAHRPRPFRPIWTGPNTPQNRQKSAPRCASRVFWKKLLPRARPPIHHPQKPPARKHPTTPVAPLPPSPCGRRLGCPGRSSGPNAAPPPRRVRVPP